MSENQAFYFFQSMQKGLNTIGYQIDAVDQEAYFIRITLSFTSITENPVLFIPAWRPGRYMLQNFAANIRDCKSCDSSGNILSIEKQNRSEWKVLAKAGSEIMFSYHYYCRQMDAGGCWSDPSLFYINPIACFMGVTGQTTDSCKIVFNLPETFKIATGMNKQNLNTYSCPDFIALTDYPVMASCDLQTFTYSVGDIPFYIHSTADVSAFPETFVSDFQAFSQAQINDFEHFPEKEYHFLLLLLPYTHYHGVEHRNSTVICLGPVTDIKEKLYTELLGICSHELLHSWNICKIRPEEMWPYDLSKENYFKTGFVAEGFTTYLGDYYLAKSGVLSIDWYTSELNILLKRHFYSFGNDHLSIADSSFDLWVDGYDAGIPARKVSIYVKGAVIAFLMDIAIRKSSNNNENILSLLKSLWSNYLTTDSGYSESDIKVLFHAYTNNTYTDAYQHWIYGTGDLKEDIIQALIYAGYTYTEEAHTNYLAGNFGILCDAHYVVQSVDPSSPYINSISKGDKILSVNDRAISDYTTEELVSLTSFTAELSNGVRQWKQEIVISEETYFKTLKVEGKGL